jgi:hypothetical protein
MSRERLAPRPPAPGSPVSRANARGPRRGPARGSPPLPRIASLALGAALACASPGESLPPAPLPEPEVAPLAEPALPLDPVPQVEPAGTAPATPIADRPPEAEASASAAPATGDPGARAALILPTPAAGLPPPRSAGAPDGAQGAEEARCERIVEIQVNKRRRRLEAICQGGARVVFPAALGRRSAGHKDEAGDLRTPEGVYHVAESARGSAYHLFMLLDYPSASDAYRALAAGRITERTYARIATAHERGEVPPQDTLLGGRIGIHGEGRAHQGFSAREDWTLGCVALSDAHMEFLADRTAVGTPVRILSGR